MQHRAFVALAALWAIEKKFLVQVNNGSDNLKGKKAEPSGILNVFKEQLLLKPTTLKHFENLKIDSINFNFAISKFIKFWC